MNQDDLQHLFPPAVRVEVALEADQDEVLLHPAERALMAAMVPARRREFTAGRNAAHRALSQLGFPAAPLPRHGADRDVEWPEGSTGSISHTKGLCAVACARTTPTLHALGLDVEQAGQLGADIVAKICRPDELLVVRALPVPTPSDWPRILFAIKEAAYKAWYPVTRRTLAFHDMRIAVDVDTQAFRGEVLREPVPGLKVTGRFGWDDRFVYAGAVLRLVR